MPALSRILRRPRRSLAAAGREYRRELTDSMGFEIIPLQSAAAQIENLPAAARVSVTASPVKPIEVTLDLSRELARRGFAVTPHLSARIVESAAHVDAILAHVAESGVNTLFVVGGDAPEPRGPFAAAADLLEVIVDRAPANITTIGIGSYPDGHPLIADEVLARAGREKLDLIEGAGYQSYLTTQMCFDADLIVRWLSGLRADGVSAAVHLGIPGAVERARLLRMSMQLGIGASTRYLKKNMGAVAKLFSPGGYDPNTLLDPMAADLERLGIAALHCFTFNAVEATERWRRDTVSRL